MICNVQFTQFFSKDCHLLILTVGSSPLPSVTVVRWQFLKNSVIRESFVVFSFLVGMDRTRYVEGSFHSLHSITVGGVDFTDFSFSVAIDVIDRSLVYIL